MKIYKAVVENQILYSIIIEWNNENHGKSKGGTL